MDTIGKIIVYDKPALKRLSKRINDAMLEDIDESIKIFATSHDCMKEMLAFPFFDETKDSNDSNVSTQASELAIERDIKEEVADCTEAILIKRKLMKKPWITISAIMDALNKEYPEVSGIATSGLVRDILSSAEWVEKDDFYYRYSKDINDIPDILKSDSLEDTDSIIAITSITTKKQEDVPESDDDNRWTDEVLEEKYKEKYYLTKELLRSEYDINQNWYTATEICMMLTERFPAVMKGKMYSIICRVLKNASWAETSEDGLRFRWKTDDWLY